MFLFLILIPLTIHQSTHVSLPLISGPLSNMRNCCTCLLEAVLIAGILFSLDHSLPPFFSICLLNFLVKPLNVCVTTPLQIVGLTGG
ncbi:MAG: hypothetical protein ACTSP4_16155 [Candidatus Hodarchaeales archaeon]